MSVKKFISFEQSRASLFNLFSALLCQPETELLSSDTIFTNLKIAFEKVCPNHISNAVQLQQTVKDYTRQELLIEYAKLFIGPFKILAPPYSSVYFNSDTLMSNETIWVVDFYSKTGLAFDEKKVKDLPDHIAIESEFMYYLIFNEVIEFKKGRWEKSKSLWRKQDEFFNRHYKLWVPKFCKKILEETENEYFKTLAICLDNFVSEVEVPPFNFANKLPDCEANSLV